MGTKALIVKEVKKDTYKGVMFAYDGYIRGIGETLHAYYQKESKIDLLINSNCFFFSTLKKGVEETIRESLNEFSKKEELPMTFTKDDLYSNEDVDYIYIYTLEKEWFVIDNRSIYGVTENNGRVYSGIMKPLRFEIKKRKVLLYGKQGFFTQLEITNKSRLMRLLNNQTELFDKLMQGEIVKTALPFGNKFFLYKQQDIMENNFLIEREFVGNNEHPKIIKSGRLKNIQIPTHHIQSSPHTISEAELDALNLQFIKSIRNQDEDEKIEECVKKIGRYRFSDHYLMWFADSYLYDF